MKPELFIVSRTTKKRNRNANSSRSPSQSNTTQTNADTTPPAPQKAQPVAADTVLISNAAKTAMLEATETPAQTAKEAKVVIAKLKIYS